MQNVMRHLEKIRESWDDVQIRFFLNSSECSASVTSLDAKILVFVNGRNFEEIISRLEEPVALIAGRQDVNEPVHWDSRRGGKM